MYDFLFQMTENENVVVESLEESFHEFVHELTETDVNNKIKGFVCSHCGKIPNTKSGHSRHERRHMISDGDSKTYECQICTRKFIDKDHHFNGHVNKHMSNTPFKC